jgi:hypothetical protein
MNRITRGVLGSAVKTAQMEVATAGATNIVIVAYADTPSGPGALALQSAPISAAATGVFTVPFSLAAGTWWLGVQNVGSVGVTLRTVLALNPYLPGIDTPGTNALNSCWYITGQGAVIPDPWPVTGIIRAGAMPNLYFQGV